jgi:drug/metabolite transporter (DMT)-like permease
LNGWALARVPSSTVAVYVYLQPLIAFVVAPMVLGESLSFHAVVASLLIFAGVLVVTRRRSAKPATDLKEKQKERSTEPHEWDLR